jgi:hypothetical protein
MLEQLEKYGTPVVLSGLAIIAVGYFWLVVRAFRTRILWGLGLVVFPPLAFVFLYVHLPRVSAPLRVLLVGWAIFIAPYAANFYQRFFVPLKPHEAVVDGEFRVTLTGLKDFDYSTLPQRRALYNVLQMANPDVTDQTLPYLRGMNQLRSLDLNDTQVTDEGLPILAELPNLQELRLARTKITDEGFKKHLAPKESLLKLDLTGTAVKGPTKRAWKNEYPEQREYVD